MATGYKQLDFDGNTTTTAAKNSEALKVPSYATPRIGLPVTLVATGEWDGEDFDIEYKDGGGDWRDLYLEGLQVQMNSTNTAVTIYAPMEIRVAKPLTTNAMGVTIYW